MVIPLGYGAQRPWYTIRRRHARFAIAVALLLPVVGFLVFDLVLGMEHKSILWPSIDTRYAGGYSERAFQSLHLGMSRQEVDQTMMCPPLFVYTMPSGDVWYIYTQDGACRWGDFAWFGRSVCFRSDRLIQIDSQVYYD